MRISTLKKRAQFQRVRGGVRWSAAAFLLEGKARTEQGESTPRFGFTVTRKLGGAVVRNRIRRRLKAAIAETALQHANPAFDYVVIARLPGLDQPYADLRNDFATAFRKVHDSAARSRTPKVPGAGPAGKDNGKTQARSDVLVRDEGPLNPSGKPG